MIARAPYLFLLLILIPDLYLDRHYWRHRMTPGKRFAYWLPSIILVIYTIILTYEKDFIPENPVKLYVYLILLGLIAIPKAVFMLCSITGLGLGKLFHRKKKRAFKNYGNLIGLLCVPVIWYIVLYGSFIGFNIIPIVRQTCPKNSTGTRWWCSPTSMWAPIPSATSMCCNVPSTVSMPNGQT